MYVTGESWPEFMFAEDAEKDTPLKSSLKATSVAIVGHTLAPELLRIPVFLDEVLLHKKLYLTISILAIHGSQGVMKYVKDKLNL